MLKVAEFNFVRHISLGGKATPMMSYARKANNIDVIHNGGDALNGTSYTGYGVLAGLIDTGIDINHCNFLDNNNKPRTKRLWTIQTATGVVTEYNTEAEILAFETDDETESHATHVLGIMTGCFNGKPANSSSGKVAYINDNGQWASTWNKAVPYYGIATKAEPVVCVGAMEEVNHIILAAQKIHDYAIKQGKPAVLNMSLGDYYGPHDGTDAVGLKLAEYGKNIIICIAAGNEGDSNISLERDFTASDNTIKTTIAKSSTASGYVDIWGDNASVLTVSFVAINKQTGEISYQYDLDRNTQGQAITISGSNWSNSIRDSKFESAFGADGYISMRSNINTLNNRYNVYMKMSLNGNASNNIVPGIIIKGSAGNGVNAFCGYSDSLQFVSNGISGYVDGTSDNSINNMACGDNVLVVGSFNNSDGFPTLSGIYTNGGYEGELSSFSSAGHTFDGRALPDITAPGQNMISSYNKYEVDNAGLTNSDLTAWITSPLKSTLKDYWGEMSGTSMATPFVSGVITLWLEADPTLTINDVKEILKETAINDEFTAQCPERWGMGKIDPLAGLKKILTLGAINTVNADDVSKNLIIESLGGKHFNVFVGGTDAFTVNLYNLLGVRTATWSTTGNSIDVDASGMSEGIYLMEVTGKNLHQTQKLVIR